MCACVFLFPLAQEMGQEGGDNVVAWSNKVLYLYLVLATMRGARNSRIVSPFAQEMGQERGDNVVAWSHKVFIYCTSSSHQHIPVHPDAPADRVKSENLLQAAVTVVQAIDRTFPLAFHAT
jgi:hypothetical protein